MINNEVHGLIPPVDKPLDDILSKFSLEINELVKVGANIIKEDMNIAGEDEKLPGLMLLRNHIELLDSISILVKGSSIEPCKIILRTLLENLIYLEFLLEKDSERRSLAYIVWNTIQNLKGYEKLDPNTETGKQFRSKFKHDKYLLGMQIGYNEEEIEELKNNAQELLSLDKFKEANEEYKRLTTNGIKNPNWYNLFFMDSKVSIEVLANKLKLSGVYELLYRGWSRHTHANQIIQGKIKEGKNGISIQQIRYAKDSQMVTQYCLMVSIPIYKLYIEKRTPHYQEAFTNWIQSKQKVYHEMLNNDIITEL